jgi:sulfur transporter
MATVADSIAASRGQRVRIRVTATTTGMVAALLAVMAGSLFDVRPPDAYGICMACHARDLVNWTVNAAAGTALTVAPASLVFPLLTPVGVLLGALLAARTSGEFRWLRPEHPVKTFVYGIVVMNGALLAGGCSIRLLLRTAAGETLGIVGFGSLAAGVILATQWLRWRAVR